MGIEKSPAILFLIREYGWWFFKSFSQKQKIHGLLLTNCQNVLIGTVQYIEELKSPTNKR